MNTRRQRAASGRLINGYVLHQPGGLIKNDRSVTEQEARQVAAINGPMIAQRVTDAGHGEVIFEDMNLYPE